MDELLKNYTFSSVYRTDYIKRRIIKAVPYIAKQEFKDPICEGFKNYLELNKEDAKDIKEYAEEYLGKIKGKKKKIGKMYFNEPLDHITIIGHRLLEGKSVYQVEYCDVEADIRRKLMETEQKKYVLPDGWVIPATTNKFFYREPTLLSQTASRPLPMFTPTDNLGQNEKINKILNVKTGESEYTGTIGKFGEFIINEQMFGKVKKVELL